MKQVRIQKMLCMIVCVGSAAACNDDYKQYDDTGHPSSGHGSGGGWTIDWGDCEPDTDCTPDKPDASDGSDPSHHGGGGPDDSADAGTPATGPRVTIAQGELEGIQYEGGIQRYLGIPYAKPPLGPLRWKPPQKPDAWTKVRPAKDFEARCAQPESLGNGATDNEDCLYLNVWTPDTSAGRRLPVMFWIHGGDNLYGSAYDKLPNDKKALLYDGASLASLGVVVVTVNYRLGLLGFFSHRELKADGFRSGNQGLWDQQFALDWVRRNIAQFGGDPRNVTIFGQGSGAFDVCAHVASPKSRGLFEQAIGQSGGCTTYQPYAEDAEQQVQTWASQLGCPDSGCLDCLRHKPLLKLLASTPKHGPTPFGPTVDRDFLPDQPRLLFDDGDFAKVPYILGNNSDEASSFGDAYASLHSDESFKYALQEAFPLVLPERILDHYSVKRFADADNPYQAAMARILGDARAICPTYDTAVRVARAEVDSWVYTFDVTPDSSADGATTGAELGYVFGSDRTLTEAECVVSDRMQHYWTDLAKWADPNDGELYSWPRFTESKDVRINFGLDSTIARDYRSSECLFWGSVYDAQLGIAP